MGMMLQIDDDPEVVVETYTEKAHACFYQGSKALKAKDVTAALRWASKAVCALTIAVKADGCAKTQNGLKANGALEQSPVQEAAASAA